MITVAGEALIDLIADDTGAVVARPGGAAFNVARFVAQLGAACTYVGLLSGDRFGDLLRAELLSAGVVLGLPEPTSAPTTLALAQLDEAGSAEYRFYVQATAAAQLVHADLPDGLLDASRVLVLGGIAIAVEPVRATLLALLESVSRSVVVVLDPNCRGDAIADLQAYRKTVSRVLRRADVLKVSVEDVAVLAPGSAPESYALDALEHGPSVVIVTDGPRELLLATTDGVRRLPVPEVDVVDTIGAGDAFVAALLTWLSANPGADLGSVAPRELQSGIERAMEVAAAVCSMRGAALPPAHPVLNSQRP